LATRSRTRVSTAAEDSRLWKAISRGTSMASYPHFFPSIVLSQYGGFNRRPPRSAQLALKIRATFQAIFVRKSNDNLLIFKYIPSVSGVTQNIACTCLSISFKTETQN
jgi:hypothetical protein